MIGFILYLVVIAPIIGSIIGSVIALLVYRAVTGRNRHHLL